MNLSIINYLTFQLGWFACVLSAASGRPALGLLTALLVLGLHLALARQLWNEVRLILASGAIGTVFDSLLLATGWVSYPSGAWLPGLAPYWIVAMWLLFGATLNLSMGWLKGRPLLAAFTGAVGGPLSYIAGEKLGAIRLENPDAALAMLAVAWAFIMPALAVLAQRWNGFRTEYQARPALTGWSSTGVEDHA